MAQAKISLTDTVDLTHPQFDAFSGIWNMMDDVLAGEHAVKARGTVYLPKGTGMEVDDYDAYRERAEFYGATKFAWLGLVGRIFRRDPEVELPKALEEIGQNINLSGRSIVDFAYHATARVMGTGRYGVLVDWSDEQKRPYWSGYRECNIVNWSEETIGGEPVLTQVVLRESESKGGRFSREDRTIYRVLELVTDPDTFPFGEDEKPVPAGTYRMSVWEPDSDADSESRYVEREHIYPEIRGVRLTRIPFYFLNPTSNDPEIEEPPLYDLAVVNISHYRTSADLETARFKCAQPTPWVRGLNDTTREMIEGAGGLKVGSNSAWLLPANIEVGMLEPSQSGGLSSLESGMATKEQRMRSLGARALQEAKRAAETEGAKRLEQSNESSVLKNVADNVSAGLTKALEMLRDWHGGNAKVSIELNRDFFETKMETAMIEAIGKAVDRGLIPLSVAWAVLREGEIIPATMTDDDLRKLIEDEQARSVFAGDMGADPDPNAPPAPDNTPDGGKKPSDAPGTRPRIAEAA